MFWLSVTTCVESPSWCWPSTRMLSLASARALRRRSLRRADRLLGHHFLLVSGAGPVRRRPAARGQSRTRAPGRPLAPPLPDRVSQPNRRRVRRPIRRTPLASSANWSSSQFDSSRIPPTGRSSSSTKNPRGRTPVMIPEAASPSRASRCAQPLDLDRFAFRVRGVLLRAAALQRERRQLHRVPRSSRPAADPLAHAAMVVQIGVSPDRRSEVTVLAARETEVPVVGFEVARPRQRAQHEPVQQPPMRRIERHAQQRLQRARRLARRSQPRQIHARAVCGRDPRAAPARAARGRDRARRTAAARPPRPTQRFASSMNSSISSWLSRCGRRSIAIGIPALVHPRPHLGHVEVERAGRAPAAPQLRAPGRAASPARAAIPPRVANGRRAPPAPRHSGGGGGCGSPSRRSDARGAGRRRPVPRAPRAPAGRAPRDQRAQVARQPLRQHRHHALGR